MSTLLFRLAGPMQSWGTQSRFMDRDTGLEPSKSGVIGLCCAALGRPRTAPIEDLVALKMGVRVDQQGEMREDFHTAMEVYKADGKKPDTVVSHRHYLADAIFLVGLEGDEALLVKLNAALLRPKWQICLGRKSCVPTLPITFLSRPDGFTGPAGAPSVVSMGLRDALVGFPLLCKPPEKDTRLRLVIQDDDGQISRADVPVSFDTRRFSSRTVKIEWLDVKPEASCYPDVLTISWRRS
jgi:CRISPR system Cascade subunit CasD